MSDGGRIHRRQVWWCWIHVDPFFPMAQGEEYSCPHCRISTVDDKSWKAYHRLLGRATEKELVPLESEE